MIQKSDQLVYVRRIYPGRVDRVEKTLESDEIIIGWSEARGLNNRELEWEDFREIVHETYYSDEPDYRVSGGASGSLWRFIVEMKKDDLVVVPYWSDFYIAEVTGDAYHDESKVGEDTAWRRPVKWLNNKQPIPRRLARLPLISRMKAYQTCVYADDLIDEIKDVLSLSAEGTQPRFEEDLRQRLIEQVIKEINSGRIDSNGFERLVGSLLEGMGAKDIEIRHGVSDKGADIVANINILNKFSLILAVQEKHYTPEPPVEQNAIEQLVSGMEAESADLGWVVTSGKYSKDAEKFADKMKDEGYKVELIDGEELAAMIIESGLSVRNIT